VRRLPKARSVASRLAPILLLLVGAACVAAPVSTRASTAPISFVIPTSLTNGRVEVTVAAAYPIGAALAIPVAVVVTRGTISGPVTARIMASGINERGLPAEVLVRELAATPVTVSAGRGSTVIAWDARDLKGAPVPADAYSLVLEFRSTDGGATTTARAGATLELR